MTSGRLAVAVVGLGMALTLAATGPSRAAELRAAPAVDMDPDSAAETFKLFDEGLASIHSGPFKLVLHARIQSWVGWVGDDALLSNGDPMQEPGFRLRRARLGIEGTLFEGLSYEIELDLFDTERAGGPLYEATIGYKPVYWFEAIMGVQKFPFLRSEMMSSAALPHLDRATGTLAMSPANALGQIVAFHPWEDRLSITLGVFNGLKRGSAFHEGYEGVGVSFGNRFEGIAGVGRVDFMPLGPMGANMADLPSYRAGAVKLAVGGSFFFNDGGSILTWAGSTYAHFKAYGLHLFFEFAQEAAEPKERPTTTSTISTRIERRAVQASLGYVFLPRVLGLALRFEVLDDNIDRESQGDEWLLTPTLTFYALGDALKVQLEYTHREELFGRSLANDTVLLGLQLDF